jgi:glycogen debranching enzyme
VTVNGRYRCLGARCRPALLVVTTCVTACVATLVATLVAIGGAAHAAHGQGPNEKAPAAAAGPAAGTIAPFDLGDSPLALRGDARPGVYLAAVGRRSIAMGTEDGRFELWSWPLKWAHDFQLAFRVPKYAAPIQGRDVARSVTARPEGVTIEYAYETFTVKQHVYAPLDLPAVIMLLEVDAVRPMEIVASFTPDVHYAWPASLGGQYLVWDEKARAFLFSESRRRVNAYLGSPATVQASDVPAHQLTAAPPQLVIAVGRAEERYTEPTLGEPPGKNVNLRVAYVPIVFAGGEMPRDSARALYERLLAPGAAEREWRRRVAHADSLRATTLSVATPDATLDRAVEWAKVNLDESLVCNPDLGCGLVAGYGPSGAASDRPGFGWFFGGDAAINSLAMTGVGEGALVRDGVLRFFAKYQRADGKIPHEISQGAAKIDWFGGYPYAFYHGDTTPFWILACGEYWRQTADTALVRELWPNLKRAYAWSAKTDADGDGLMENTLAGAGALEVGELQAGIVSDVYLSGVWVAALERVARMATAVGERALADSARAIRTRAVRTLEAKLWLPAARQYAFALLEGGRVNESLTAWPATAMSFDVLEPMRGAEMAERLASSAVMTDWGARPLAATSRLFDPLHYNNGAVWPFVTGWVALAQYRYHNAHAGRFALDAVARTGFDEARGRNPEVISGRLYKPLDTAVPHQFFATSMMLTPLVRGLLGLDVDAAAGRVTVAPHLPPEWDSVRVERVPVGRDHLFIAIRRRADELTATVVRRGPGRAPIEVVFSPALPLGATVDGSSPGDAMRGDVHAPLRGQLLDSLTWTVRTQGGWSVAPPRLAPAVGDRSRALRVVGERLLSGVAQYGAFLEGRAGETYTLRLRTPSRGRSPRLSLAVGGGGAAPVPVAAARVGAADDRGFREVRVTFPREGADADGYVRAVLYATELLP